MVPLMIPYGALWCLVVPYGASYDVLWCLIVSCGVSCSASPLTHPQDPVFVLLQLEDVDVLILFFNDYFVSCYCSL